VPAHKATSFCQLLTPKNVTTLYHPQYSPDLSPPDHFLFPKLKLKLKGIHFADVGEIQVAVTDELKKVQKEEFSTAFQKMYDRAEVCIYTNGAYFKFKKGMCLSHVFSILKNLFLKIWTALSKLKFYLLFFFSLDFGFSDIFLFLKHFCSIKYVLLAFFILSCKSIW
jgi:hypothetical protein